MEKEPKFIPKEEIQPEEQEKLEKLEIDTDELYRLKIETQSIFNKIAPYLPEIQTKIQTSPGEIREISRPANWHDVLRWQSEGKLDEILKEGVARELPEKETAKVQRRVKARLNDVNKGLSLIEQISQQEEDALVRRYKWFRLRELALAKKDLSKIEEAININREMLRDTVEEEDIDDIRNLEKEYRELNEQYQKVIHSSPEAYLWQAGQNLLEIKKTFAEHGTIVETPYVKEKLGHILDEVKERPVFIHGELSTGKTELAKHVSRKYLSHSYVERWEKEHPKPQDPEVLKEWERLREEAMEPLEVRGMRGLEKEDILVRTVLEREKVPPPEKQVKFLMQARENFKKEVIKKAAKNIRDPKEKEEFIKSSVERLEQAYMEKWKSGIVTIEQLSPIFQAMKEGRPIIIDEMNAIPHHVLIVLNDMINKRPGQKVNTPTGEQITVQEGYALIATGNWKPGDSVLYPGRAILDAAYLSRFGIEDYDFLPQAIQRESETIDPEVLRKERQENELFMMMMTRLLDNQLGVKLPEGSISKIKELARMARVLQDVFSEKSVDKAFWAREGKINPKDVLKENVLAYRQLFPILERWRKDGFIRPLDDYIFLEYVQRSSARPQEMKYIYNILQTQGDFFQGEDWPRSTGKSDADISRIKAYNIVRKIYGVEALSQAKKPMADLGTNLRYYSPKEVIEEIFGPVPERRRYKIETLGTKMSEETVVDQTREELEELREFKTSFAQDLENLGKDVEDFCKLEEK